MNQVILNLQPETEILSMINQTRISVGSEIVYTLSENP